MSWKIPESFVFCKSKYCFFCYFLFQLSEPFVSIVCELIPNMYVADWSPCKIIVFITGCSQTTLKAPDRKYPLILQIMKL